MVSFVTLATVFGTFVAFGRWLDGAITDEARNRILAALLEPWPVSRFAGIVQIVPDRLASILGSPFSAKFVLSSFLASVLCTAVLTASFAPWSDMAENVGWASAMKLTFFSFAIAAAFNVIADLFSNWETLYIVKRIGETRGTVAILFLVVLDLLLSGLLSVGLLAFFELVSSGSARDLIGESPYIISKKSADCWSSAVEPIETNKQDYIDTMVAVRRMQNIPIRKSDGSPILPGWVLEKHGRYKEAERRAMACIESERGGFVTNAFDWWDTAPTARFPPSGADYLILSEYAFTSPAKASLMRATLAAVTLSTFAGSILIIGFGTISLAYRRFVDIELVKRRIPSVINFSQHLMTIVLALLGLVVDAGLIVGALLLN